jgi:hypothetical protein
MTGPQNDNLSMANLLKGALEKAAIFDREETGHQRQLTFRTTQRGAFRPLRGTHHHV